MVELELKVTTILDDVIELKTITITRLDAVWLFRIYDRRELRALMKSVNWHAIYYVDYVPF